MYNNITTLLNDQRDIIRILTYSPYIFVNYIHYRESDDIEFQGSPIPIPSIPFIPYNDPTLCSIINDINDNKFKPLGPKGKVGTPYLITDKELSNGYIIAKLTTIDKLHAKYLIKPPTSLSSFIGRSEEINHCISDIQLSNIRYIASDEFTNETLISYILNYLVIENSKVGNELPLLFVRHYKSGICNDNIGINLMEYCDLGTLDKFTYNMHNYEIDDNGKKLIRSLIDSDTIRQILTQIIVALHMLQTLINFTSGDLKAGNVFIKSDPIDIKYQGISLKSPFTCKIADYGKSSCMLYKSTTAVRFFNDNNLATAYLSIHPFTDDIIINDKLYYYSIGNTFNSQVYTRTRHMGLPFYHSFDYYTVLVSMLTNPSFYYMFFSNNLLRELFWDPIWDPQSNDSTIAMEKIHHYVIENKGKSINDAINILRGLKLKCSAVTDIISILQNY